MWSDGKATQEVRPVSDGVVPIGLCVIPTNWLDEGEKARFVSLKWMSSETPESGGLLSEQLHWGVSYGEGSPMPYDDENDDPLISYYIPYVCRTPIEGYDCGQYKWDTTYFYFNENESGSSKFLDLRIRENWLSTQKYCNENPGKYAIGDINGKQNTINISIEGNYNDDIEHDMKPIVAKYAPVGTHAGDWYVPSLTELLYFCLRLGNSQNFESINNRLSNIANIYPQHCVNKFVTKYDNDSMYIYSSTVNGSSGAYVVHMSYAFNNLFIYFSNDTFGQRGGWSHVVAFLQR